MARLDIREWHNEQWIYMDGRPYRKATRHEVLAAQVAAEPVADPVAAVQAVARLGERAS